MAKQEKTLPIVLILDRRLDPNEAIAERNNKIPLLVDLWFRWTDSSGSRSVWFWSPTPDYDDAEDLPLEVFEIVEQWVTHKRRCGEFISICMRREDPGIGIYIPEVDNAVIAAGELPDGVIQITPKSPD